MFKLCIELNIYTTSQIEGDVETVKDFHNWILIEILTTLSTIMGAMIYLALRRAAGKGHLTI